MSLDQEILRAFSGRECPAIFYTSTELTKDEVSAVLELKQLHPGSYPIDFLQKNYDVVFWLSPQAFCYCLPGFVVASLREKGNLLVADAIIAMLDRSSLQDCWEKFFCDRWLLLERGELIAIQRWLIWILDNRYDHYDISRLNRAFDVLSVLVDDERR
jgi:hypothetical protein